MAISPADTSAVSFAADIVSLFRPMDIQCMSGRGIFLADYTFMTSKGDDGVLNSLTVLAFLKGDSSPRMPFGGPYWSGDSLNLLQSWIDGGMQP